MVWEQWSQEWTEDAIKAGVRHALPWVDGHGAGYSTFVAYLSGWFKGGGISEEAQAAMNSLLDAEREGMRSR